jgi:hypothetical protein
MVVDLLVRAVRQQAVRLRAAHARRVNPHKRRIAATARKVVKGLLKRRENPVLGYEQQQRQQQVLVMSFTPAAYRATGVWSRMF